jgi:hypothetical protein
VLCEWSGTDQAIPVASSLKVSSLWWPEGTSACIVRQLGALTNRILLMVVHTSRKNDTIAHAGTGKPGIYGSTEKK